MMLQRARLYALERGGLLALCVLITYAWLAPVHVVDGDNAEFATLAVTGGAAHPSGYPLYVLWLRITSWLPAASPAHAAALATAFIGAVCMLVLHAACRAWGARPFAATIAVAIFAAGPIVARFGSEAEVFALNNLIVALVLWLSARHGPVTGGKRAALLGLVAGLGIANHLTCTLVTPIGVLGIVRAGREARHVALATGWAVIGFVIGLSPYAYLLLAPDTHMSWGTVRDLDGLIGIITRRDYGGPMAFRVAAVAVSPWDSITALATTIGRTWLCIPALAGIATLVRGIVRGSDGETRWGWTMLAISWVLSGPLLALRFNVPPQGLGLYVCQRFHILPALLLAIPTSIAGNWLASRVGARTATLAAICTSVGFVALVATSLPYLGGVHSPAVELGAQNMLRSLPEHSIILHGQDELHATTGYLQAALGVRQDVEVVTVPMLGVGWYRDRAHRRGILPLRGASDLRRIVEYNLARGRAVFVDPLQHDIIRTFPAYPYGVLLRVLPRGAAMPSVHDVFLINQQLFATFRVDYPLPKKDDEFAAEVHRRYSAVWDIIGRKLEGAGDPVEAAQAFSNGRRLAPR